MTVETRPRAKSVNRMARLPPPPEPKGSVTVPTPPRLEAAQGGVIGWLQYLFPVLGSLGAMLFIFNNPKPLFVASALLFMLGSIGMGAGMAAQQRMTASRREQSTRTRYLEHLASLRGELRANAEAQRAALAWRHPPPDALLALTAMPSRLWERRSADSDFLQLRAGRGAVPLATTITVPPRDPTGPATDPICADAANALVTVHSVVPDAVISIDLKQAPVVCIAGPRAARLDLARAMCCELAAMHAPEDLQLLLCVSPDAADDWQWIKWLPHLVDVSDESGLDIAVAARIAQSRTAKAGSDLVGPGAWLVAIVDGVNFSADLVTRLRRSPTRTSFVVLAGSRSDEPESADVRIETGAGRLSLHLAAVPGTMTGVADRLGMHSAEAVARRLAPLRLSEDPAARRLADSISLTDLLGIDDVATLDAQRSWRTGPLTEILRVPLGVSSQGEPVVLDVKESALGGDGPHGLVIGATGSGKSELLRTIVTGLALTHAPELVSFVLADFKGGAAFAGLMDLPHVSGLITNLADDLAMVDRMHAALFGEIRRRQELLRAAGNLASLRDYHRRRAEGADLAPLPYLLLIVDEFGELLASRPDFIDLFVAVGRLGRSLGMHLLLSSQQLDEGRLRGLESHLSYRIALRTFSAAESRTVLGVPDAYELPPIPGSAYLKVGTTVYTRFRAALVSQVLVAPAAAKLASQGLRPFVLGGGDADGEPAVLEVAVERLRDAAPKAHQVWLPPLEARVPLDSVLARWVAGNLSVPIGLIDKPEEQSRDLLAVDFSGSAGHVVIVGASLTGKTTLLRTLISSFALTHTPLQAQFYCIDFGGGGLAPLASLPHVGGVAGRQDPERVRRTVAEIAALLDEREARFVAAGIDSPGTLRSRRDRGELEGDGWADVFLVIDNWPAVKQEFEELEAQLLEIASRGLGYGVHLVLTSNRWIDVRSSLRESIGGRLELRLHDPAESAINRRAAENVAKGVPGRGITAASLHFQVAMPRIDGSTDVLDQQRALEQLVAAAAGRWKGAPARPVVVLPPVIRAGELAKPSAGSVALGLSERDLGTVFVDLGGSDPHFLVFGDGESGKTNTLRTIVLGLLSSLTSEQAQILVIDYRRTLLGVVEPDYQLGYAGAEPTAVAQLAETGQALTRRLPPADISIETLRARSWWEGPEVYVVVDDYDLVATPSGNPLLPLLPLLAQARDVGLHVVIARRTGGAGRGILEPVLLRLRELGTPGLLLSGDPQEGALLGSSRASPQRPGRGLLVRRHERPSLVQVALSDSTE
jgi:S-DNA-T family DNA segregation ATPase FtsK/SpoIIIE